MQALSIRGLTKTYANGVQALRGIDLDVQEGDFFALLGPNGAGKTTTIGIIMSLVEKSGGSVSVFGHDIDRELDQREVLHRPRAAGNQLQPVREGVHDHREPGGLLRHSPQARRGAIRKIPAAAAAVGQARPDRTLAFRRDEAPPHDRALAGPRAAPPDPRRADGGRRHRDPAQHVGIPAHHQRAGNDDHPDDPLPRGGGEPLPPHRDHRRRPDHRERHDGGRHPQAVPGDLRPELPCGDGCAARARRVSCRE